MSKLELKGLVIGKWTLFAANIALAFMWLFNPDIPDNKFWTTEAIIFILGCALWAFHYELEGKD